MSPLTPSRSIAEAAVEPASAATVPTFEDIERQVATFEASERRRLGLEAPAAQWHDSNPQSFTRGQRDATTILLGGLTQVQDGLVQAALGGLGYRIEILDSPDVEALHVGKEFGNRGQCNPAYFTVGNLVKHLIRLRDVEGVPVDQIVERYLFLTAGACGPCRFGTYVTEYRKALRDAGFEGFRVLLFQQTGGLEQATGADCGLELSRPFFLQLVKAIVAGDVLNATGYRIRPYEIEPGSTDLALERAQALLARALRERRSVVRALRRCRALMGEIAVDRLQAKPKVTIIGEFWAMTTEGDGNYHLQRFLESEGAEVDVQLVTSWILYLIWQTRHDTLQRIDLRHLDDGRQGLKGKSGRRILAYSWLAEKALRLTFSVFARALGLKRYHLPDMDLIARLAGDHYDVELRGGEGHMEVGKTIHSFESRKAHMVVSVKPFGCMPSSGVSDGVQSAVMSRMPTAIFCPVETTGDGAVGFQSRVLMYLFKARRRARTEFDSALADRRLSLAAARRALGSRQSSALHQPVHHCAGTGANLARSLR